MKTHIIGMGVVGQAMFNSVKSIRLDDVTCYDIDPMFKTFTDTTSIGNRDDVFICVDTPTNLVGIQDASKVTDLLDILVNSEHNGLVMIKSTILYMNIKKYIDKLKLVMVPEFLEAVSSSYNFAHSLKLILGGKYSRQAYELHINLFNFVEGNPDPMYCTIKEAIDFKYTRNLLQAYNVLFWEGIQLISGNANKMASMMHEIPANINSQISKDGYKGFGQSLEKDSKDFSACLDKDLSAIKKQNPNPMLTYMSDFNHGLM